jgi:hypothetical protein
MRVWWKAIGLALLALVLWAAQAACVFSLDGSLVNKQRDGGRGERARERGASEALPPKPDAGGGTEAAVSDAAPKS